MRKIWEHAIAPPPKDTLLWSVSSALFLSVLYWPAIFPLMSGVGVYYGIGWVQARVPPRLDWFVSLICLILAMYLFASGFLWIVGGFL